MKRLFDDFEKVILSNRRLNIRYIRTEHGVLLSGFFNHFNRLLGMYALVPVTPGQVLRAVPEHQWNDL